MGGEVAVIAVAKRLFPLSTSCREARAALSLEQQNKRDTSTSIIAKRPSLGKRYKFLKRIPIANCQCKFHLGLSPEVRLRKFSYRTLFTLQLYCISLVKSFWFIEQVRRVVVNLICDQSAGLTYRVMNVFFFAYTLTLRATDLGPTASVVARDRQFFTFDFYGASCPAILDLCRLFVSQFFILLWGIEVSMGHLALLKPTPAPVNYLLILTVVHLILPQRCVPLP